jgi:hypothetical protein
MKEVTESTKKALFKLAFFEPNLSDDRNSQILDYLILDCISGYGILMDCSTKDISTYIKNTFFIDFDEAEIVQGATRLEKRGCLKILEPEHSFDTPRYRYIEREDTKELRNYKEIVELENLVFAEWSDILNEKYKKILDPEKTLRIIESFKTFLTKMFVRHGKESVSILYPESEKTQEWIDSIQSEIIKDLPRLDKELDIILQIEIPIFIKSNTEHRKNYLNNLFNASFLWHLIQVDESCSEYFKETTKGQILVLDNNILFSLIGFHGKNVLNSIHNLLNYANKLDYKIVVTTKTLNEFYESLRINCEKASEFPSFTKNIATAAIETLDSNNFLVTYWKEFIAKGLSIEEFAIEKTYIKSILEGFNISITNDFRDEIEKSQELLDEESILRTACGNFFSQSIIEHDAFHCIFIKKLRKEFKYKYSEAHAWFLTHDSKLPVFARAGLKGRKALPFCISTNEWIQINRPFLKRSQGNEEFEQSFHFLVTQPYLRSILTNFKVDKIKEKLLSRLNRYNNMGSQLAFELATDVHFLSTLSKEKNEKDFDEKIDSIIVDLNRDLKSENKELYTLIDQQADESQKKFKSLNTAIEGILEQLTSKISSVDTISNEMAVLREQIGTTERQKEEIQSEKQEITKEFEKYKNITKWTSFIIIVVLSTIIIWYFDRLISQGWYKNLPHKAILKIISNIIITLIALNIPFSKHWKVWIPLICAFLVALFKIGTTS